MGYESLEQLLQSTDNIAEYFRGIDLDRSVYSPAKRGSFPDEYTNWIEEQRAIQESCVIVDQSHHMMSLHIEGPDALDLFSDLGVNGFDDFRSGPPPQAKQLVQCSPDGYSIRDVVLFYLDDEYFVSVGSPVGNNWIAFNLETGEYDASIERPIYSPIGDYEPIGNGDVLPPDFRFEVQGPLAKELVEDVTDDPLPEIPFFEVGEITIDGHDIYALGHGMAEAYGLEIFGPYDLHDDIQEAILEAGRDYDIRQLGSMVYKTGKVGSGWIKLPVPGIYESDELKEYREWLGTETIEANMAIGGSFLSNDITDYYMTPVELGYGRHVELDHDFVGREAVENQLANPQRKKVTFVWNHDDVTDVYASLFRDGETYKFIDLPDVANRWSKTHYDRVEKDGEMVGISKYPGYLTYERELLSLGVIDTEYSTPGTEVSFVWGEENSKKSRVERHVEKTIRATVAPCPFANRGRRDME
jgi:vanillate/3-O-methylgallate O-demethylase